MRFSEYIREDIDYINTHIVWSDYQREIFELLVRGRLTDAGIMRELNLSHGRYYENKRELQEKISRILGKNQV